MARPKNERLVRLLNDPRCVVTENTLISRLQRGWDEERAMTELPRGTILWRGEARKTKELCAEFGVDYEVFISRRKRGASDEEALTGEFKRGRKPQLHEWNGLLLSTTELAERSGFKERTIRARLDEGWTVEEAVNKDPEERALKARHIREIAAKAGVTPGAIMDRQRRGCTPDQIAGPKRTLTITAWGETKTVQEWVDDPRCPYESYPTLHARIFTYGVPPEVAISDEPKSFRSFQEEALADLIEGLGFTIERSNRTIIVPFELDIYVPSKKLAFEYNGLYWHSEKFKGKNYHYDKWKACKEAGVQLIQIWEDDWTLRRPVVEGLVRAKLGLGPPAIGARKLDVILDPPVAQVHELLTRHHIQGPSGAGATLTVGLATEDRLVGAACFRRTLDRWTLTRYVSSVPITGGLQRCTSKFMKEINPPSVQTFADHCLSDGSLYERNGWVLDAELPPDYKYVVDGRREHKFNYRINRFRTDPDLIYVEGATERELAEINDIPKTYDAGKTRYSYESE